MPNAQYCVLAPAAQPQVASIHQKFHAVFFRRDRKRIVGGDLLHNLQVRDFNLVSPGRPFFGAHLAPHPHAGLVRQMPATVKHFLRHRRFDHDRLEKSRAVTKHRKQQFARPPQVVQPRFQPHALPVEFSDAVNRDAGSVVAHHRLSSCSNDATASLRGSSLSSSPRSSKTQGKSSL